MISKQDKPLVPKLKFNKSEKEIINFDQDYFVFIDETGDPTFHKDLEIYKDHSIFPVMNVTATIISSKKYQDIFLPKLNQIKLDLFNSEDIYFHSREIRRKDGIFKIFLDKIIYEEFKKRIDDLIKESEVKIISCSINKEKLLKKTIKFKKETGENYNIGNLYLKNVEWLLERLGEFLNKQTGKIIFEARGKKENKKIQAVLSNTQKDGTFYQPANKFTSINQNITFFDKKANITGLQLADYCCYPFARFAKNSKDNDNKLFHLLREYVYKGKSNEYGLKIWP